MVILLFSDVTSIVETARIRSLREPEKKMSKSDTDSKSCIYLTDTEDSITKKIKKAVTDFTSEVCNQNYSNNVCIPNKNNLHSLTTVPIHYFSYIVCIR